MQVSPVQISAGKALLNLQKLGFVRETTGKQKHRVFAYTPYLKVLAEGTETPA